MHHFRLIRRFIRIAIQKEMAYRANFYISLLHGTLNFATGVLGVIILFGQIEQVRGWDFNATLAILGVYLTASAVRGIFISPSLDALAGLGGDIWTGRFDFTLLRPVDTQFFVSFQNWRPLAVFDLALGIGTLGVAIARLNYTLELAHIFSFIIALAAGMVILYATLLFFATLVFWSPGFLFTWVFDGIFQMARYPVGLYPGWARLVMTWIIPVGVVTTVPAEALTGQLSLKALLGTVLFAAALLAAVSTFFHRALRRYASASS